MKRIIRELAPDNQGSFTLALHPPGKIIMICIMSARRTLWVEQDVDDPVIEPREFKVIVDYETIPEGAEYVGSFDNYHHLYELK